MRFMKPLTAVAVVATLATTPLLAQESQSADITDNDRAEMIVPSVEFSTAVETATQNAKGSLVSLELDYLEDKPVYSAILESETSVSMLLIDAVNGEVIASNVMQATNTEMLELLFGDDEHEEDFNDGEYIDIIEECFEILDEAKFLEDFFHENHDHEALDQSK